MMQPLHTGIATSRRPLRTLWVLAGFLCATLWLAPTPGYSQSTQLLKTVEVYAALSAKGDHENALAFAERALRLAEREFGTRDPNYAIVLSNLAESYRRLNFNDAAEPLFRRAVTTMERSSKADEVDLAGILNNFAMLYAQQSRFVEAEPLFVRSLTLKERALGDGHPDVALTLVNYAALLRYTDRVAQAIQLETRAAEIRANPQEARPRTVETNSRRRRAPRNDGAYGGP